MRTGMDALVFEAPDLGLAWQISGAGPVQAFGTIRPSGREFYFRARHDRWEFEVSDENGELPSDNDQPAIYHVVRPFKDASYMSYRCAHRIISRCLMEYLKLRMGVRG